MSGDQSGDEFNHFSIHFLLYHRITTSVYHFAAAPSSPFISWRCICEVTITVSSDSSVTVGWTKLPTGWIPPIHLPEMRLDRRAARQRLHCVSDRRPAQNEDESFSRRHLFHYALYPTRRQNRRTVFLKRKNSRRRTSNMEKDNFYFSSAIINKSNCRQVKKKSVGQDFFSTYSRDSLLFIWTMCINKGQDGTRRRQTVCSPTCLSRM